MRSANRKNPKAKKAQRQLTSFFQAKAKGTADTEVQHSKRQPTQQACDSVRAVGHVEHQIPPLQERHPSGSALDGEVGKTSKFFDGSRPSKRAKMEDSEDFEIIEDDLKPSAGGLNSPGVNGAGTLRNRGGNATLPAHAEEVHQKFQVKGTIARGRAYSDNFKGLELLGIELTVRKEGVGGGQLTCSSLQCSDCDHFLIWLHWA